MLYAAILHLLAGTVTGSVFRVRTLLLLLTLILAEALALAVTKGSSAAPWALINIFGAQAGYLAGVYLRSVLASAGYFLPSGRRIN